MDFLFDDISRGRKIKVLNVTEEFTRESLAGHVARSITAKGVVGVLEEIVHERGVPEHVRCDNGPEFVSHALRRWRERRGSRDPVHRAGLTVAECLRRVLQRQAATRAAERGGHRLRLRCSAR
jgi:Integrase core domain